jgi:hypothetical protein
VRTEAVEAEDGHLGFAEHDAAGLAHALHDHRVLACRRTGKAREPQRGGQALDVDGVFDDDALAGEHAWHDVTRRAARGEHVLVIGVMLDDVGQKRRELLDGDDGDGGV